MRSLQSQAQAYTRVQWALGILLAMGLGAFYLAGYRPATSRQAGLLMQMSARQRDLEQNQNRARNLPILAAEVQQLERRVAAYGRQFPRQPELGEFIREITRISQQLSLSDWKYQPGAPRRGDSYFELPIQMHLEGDFVNVATFLRQIEDMQRLTRVRKLGFKVHDSKAGTVEADITMNIYFSEG
jgi:type IV pilus assembly protein PilO